MIGASTLAVVDESTGSADGVPAGQPSTLIRMASGDGRYGQPDAGAGDRGSDDLWGEDPPSWERTRSYYPGTTQPRHAADAWWPPRPEPTGTTGENRRVPAVDPDQLRDDPRWHAPLAPTERGGSTPTPRASQSRLDSLVQPARPRPVTTARPGSGGARHSIAAPPRVERTAADATYGQLLSLVAVWYLAPLLVTTVWLLFLDDDRRTLVYRALLTNLPWAFGAFVLSLGVATLLRLAAVSWRAWTLTFAAGVIGAGLVTVLHSFTL
jgi:hypothetical protein